MRLFTELLVTTLAGGALGGVATAALTYCATLPTDRDPLAMARVAGPMGFLVGAVLGLVLFLGRHGSGGDDGAD